MRCVIPGCDRNVPFQFLMCNVCWGHIPRNMRDEVYQCSAWPNPVDLKNLVTRPTVTHPLWSLVAARACAVICPDRFAHVAEEWAAKLSYRSPR